MSLIYEGKTIGFILGLIFFVILIYATKYLKGRTIRPITGLDAIEEAVGRAVEMGRPVHNCPGLGGFDSQYAQQTVAAIGIIGHVAKLCASRGADLKVSIGVAHTLPAVEEIIRTSYLSEGQIDQYSPDMVRFLPNQNALFSYCMGMFEREKIAANIMVGAYFWEAIVLAEHGGSVGAMQIGGTARQSQLPAFVASCDYLILGDEMFAANAYVTQDEQQISNIAGQDIVRIIVLLIMILGSLASLAGIDVIANFLSI
jgi:hypothetical protein